MVFFISHKEHARLDALKDEEELQVVAQVRGSVPPLLSSGVVVAERARWNVQEELSLQFAKGLHTTLGLDGFSLTVAGRAIALLWLTQELWGNVGRKGLTLKIA